MLSPIQVFFTQLRWCFDISTHNNTINQRANERGKAKDEEDYSENPMETDKNNQMPLQVNSKSSLIEVRSVSL